VSFDKTLFTRYLEYYDSLGLACIPLKPGPETGNCTHSPSRSNCEYCARKVPLVKWKNQKQHPDDVSEYGGRKMDISTFDWWSRFNIGVLCGPASGNLLAFDFDNLTVMPPIHDTLITRTRRGFHVWLRLENPKAYSLSRRGMEVKYSGYIAVPPSRHPHGFIYNFANNPRKIRTVTDMPEAFRVLGLKPPRIRLDKDVQAAPEGQTPEMPEWMPEIWSGTFHEGVRHRTALIYASYLARNPPYGQGFKDPATILEHLSRWNRQRCKPPIHEPELPHIVEMALSRGYTFLRDPFLEE